MPFDRKLARTLLEICRYTYAVGVGNVASSADAADALRRLNTSAGPRPISDPMVLRGQLDPTSVATATPFADWNVIAYMGTEAEFVQTDFGLAAALQIVESLHDWSDNFKAQPVPFRLRGNMLGRDGTDEVSLEGLVHRGFLAQLRAVQAQAVTMLRKLGGPMKLTIVTGHSQGGAEAALATRAFAAAGLPVAATYTFAAPRPGTAEFSASLATPIYRIEYGNDIVPHLPPGALRAGLLGLLGAQTLIAHIPAVAKLSSQLESLSDFGYVGVGQLCYGAADEPAFHIGLPAEQENQLLPERLSKLLADPLAWADHHHLAGTSTETAAGRRGNYTTLVSDRPLA